MADAQIAHRMDKVELEMAKQGWKPKKSGGDYGSEVHTRVSQELEGLRDKSGNKRWYTEVWVDLQTNKILGFGPNPGFQTTQHHAWVDAMYVKPGYVPKKGDVLDPNQIEDLYELKTSARGRIRQDQRDKYKKIINGGNPHGPRDIKTLTTKYSYDPAAGIVHNQKYKNRFVFYGIIAGLLGHTIAQDVSAMVSYSDDEGQFDSVAVKFRDAAMETDPTQKRVKELVAKDALFNYLEGFGSTMQDSMNIGRLIAQWHTLSRDYDMNTIPASESLAKPDRSQAQELMDWIFGKSQGGGAHSISEIHAMIRSKQFSAEDGPQSRLYGGK